MVVPFASEMAMVNQHTSPPLASAEGVSRGWCARVLYNFIHVVKLLQLNHYKGLGGNEKLTPRKIATLGIVQ